MFTTLYTLYYGDWGLGIRKKINIFILIKNIKPTCIYLNKKLFIKNVIFMGLCERNV